MDFTELLAPERAERLRRLILGAINDAYTENCGRFSDDLGDNALTFAVAVVHNLRHLLEQALEFEAGVQITRPRNSFQVELDGRLAIHFYKGRSGAGDVGEIRFDESRTKLELVSENSDQLALEFDDDLSDCADATVRHLVVIHVGAPLEGFAGAWIGAPVLSRVNGFQWLWVEQLHGRSPARSALTPPPTVLLDESTLPELIIELRQPGEGTGEANTAS